MPQEQRKILVTSALPYVNGSPHMGHMVEYIQTDIWVRFQKLRGHNCIYVCASDAHGTPIMLKARELGITPEQLTAGYSKEFIDDFSDFGIEFDRIPEKYSGPLWLEVAPRSFNVKVRAGSRLTQVRIKSGSPPSSDAFVRRINEECRFIRTDAGPANIKDGAIALSVNLQGDPVSGIVGYKAKKTDEFIDMDNINYYDKEAFWDCVYRPDSGGIILKTDEFHILATKEAVAVPSRTACVRSAQ